MPYKGSWHSTPESRLAATALAIVPASIAAGAIGTALLMIIYCVAGGMSGGFSGSSLEDILGFLVFGGAALVMGAIGGTFVVGFYLVLAGLPIALLLGERIRGPFGLAAAIGTGFATVVVISRWLWDAPWISGAPASWENLIILSCFAIPAAWFYRRQVIAMLDEHDL